MDPALYAQVKAAALHLCRQAAALGLPWGEALGEVRREIAAEPTVTGQEELQAMELVLGVVDGLAGLGALLPAVGLPVAEVAEPAKGPAVALPGGLSG